ncbi:MAG TPA: S41 family peptidase [Gemmatimonadales bacterium]|nr:S41 family peptidase [Gemmatimonadales bacterium]
MSRLGTAALSAAAAIGAGIIALTVRTPSRSAEWIREYQLTRHYLATADANFDWVVARRKLDLPALDSATRQRIEHAWFSFGATAATRDFVSQFGDGHTWTRVRPGIWWRGVTARKNPRPVDASDLTAAEAPASSRGAELTPTMSAAVACSTVGLDVNARPDGWDLPFAKTPGALVVEDSEFPAVLVKVTGGRTVGILRVANFGHEHFGPSCARAWYEYRSGLPVPCTGDCVDNFQAAVIRHIALRAAAVANELQRRGAQMVVADITGNGGGSELADAMARTLTATPLHIAAGGFIRHPLHARDLADTRRAIAEDSAHATPVQQALIRIAELRLDSLITEAERECHRDRVWSGGVPDCSNVVIAPPVVSYLEPGALDGLTNGWAIWMPSWYKAPEGVYRGPLLVLQDHRSASASEEFAARLRDNGAALIIGSRSYGAGCGYSNGGTSLELPALGLLVRAPDCQRLRMDGSNETEGIAPDVDAGWSRDDKPADRVRKALDAIGRAMQ